MPEPLTTLHARATRVELDVSGVPDRVPICALHIRGTGTQRVLCLHGNPSHMDHFGANVEWLRGRGDVALLDLPGFGESPAPAGPLTLDFLAEVVAAHARSIGWLDGVDVIGHSHGGAVAQTLAVRYPGLVRSLVLLGSMGYPAHLSMRLAMLPGAAAVTLGIARRATRSPWRAVARAFARAEGGASFAPDPVPPGFLEAELARVVATPEIQRSSVRANDGDPTRQLAAQADQLRAPLLMVHGRGDRLVPVAYARRLFDRIGGRHPQSAWVDVEGGHMVHLSRPEVVHDVVGRWWDDLLPDAPRTPSKARSPASARSTWA